MIFFGRVHTSCGEREIFESDGMLGGVGYAAFRWLMKPALVTPGNAVRRASPSETNRACFSGVAYGHTGYTGTSVWIDPPSQLFAVLLTNRVHPTSNNLKISRVRPAFHTAVAEAYGV